MQKEKTEMTSNEDKVKKNQMTEDEKKALQKLESKIKKGLTSWITISEALAEIKDKSLYRDPHNTFEAYCRKKWDMTPQHANRLIKANELKSEVDPILEKLGVHPITSERTLRELVNIPSAELEEKLELVAKHAKESANKKGLKGKAQILFSHLKVIKPKGKKREAKVVNGQPATGCGFPIEAEILTMPVDNIKPEAEKVALQLLEMVKMAKLNDSMGLAKSITQLSRLVDICKLTYQVEHPDQADETPAPSANVSSINEKEFSGSADEALEGAEVKAEVKKAA